MKNLKFTRTFWKLQLFDKTFRYDINIYIYIIKYILYYKYYKYDFPFMISRYLAWATKCIFTYVPQ